MVVHYDKLGWFEYIRQIVLTRSIASSILLPLTFLPRPKAPLVPGSRGSTFWLCSWILPADSSAAVRCTLIWHRRS